MSEKTCQVQNCDGAVAEAFDFASGPLPWQARVCATHGLQLRGGEPHMYDPEADKLLIGKDVPPDVIEIKWKQVLGPTTLLTFVLGRHGVEESEVTVRVTPDLRDKLAHPFVAEMLRREAEDR